MLISRSGVLVLRSVVLISRVVVVVKRLLLLRLNLNSFIGIGIGRQLDAVSFSSSASAVIRRHSCQTLRLGAFVPAADAHQQVQTQRHHNQTHPHVEHARGGFVTHPVIKTQGQDRVECFAPLQLGSCVHWCFHALHSCCQPRCVHPAAPSPTSVHHCSHTGDVVNHLVNAESDVRDLAKQVWRGAFARDQVLHISKEFGCRCHGVERVNSAEVGEKHGQQAIDACNQPHQEQDKEAERSEKAGYSVQEPLARAPVVLHSEDV
mmetsp:Transcript_41574/g.81550  ORF Transcript_41574/g.81550 Transcript_41574/m.81550 type:complete len:263 (-) Transcript_41574:579-1367(-)